MGTVQRMERCYVIENLKYKRVIEMLDKEKKIIPMVDNRRTVRIKRSGLHRYELGDLYKPSLKFAETRKELEQAFSLVYEVYLKKKYVPQPCRHKMLYNIYSLLPDTTHIVAKSNLQVISNLTQIFDSPKFGLPMDAIYKHELDHLREQGRSIIELSYLATPKDQRWKNIFLYLVQVMYWYSVYKEVDDVCITVNPRHVRYYMKLFPFEYLGPQRHYERVGAPAVALRGKVREAKGQMQEITRSMGFETSLFSYFDTMTEDSPYQKKRRMDSKSLQIMIQPNRLKMEIVQYFLDLDPSILHGLNSEQLDELIRLYPSLVLECPSRRLAS
jgi:hypothetical protein